MPPKTIYHYVPTAGVRADFKRLMNEFISAQTVRYEQFCEMWRKRRFSFLCAGRCTDRETREYLERVLLIAIEFFLPPYQFQVRVGGLYLLYGIYMTQPIAPKVKVRLTVSQWEDTIQLQQEASEQNHLDVVYVFNKMLEEHAFQFCYTPSEMNERTLNPEREDDEVNLADDMKVDQREIDRLFNYESMEQLSYLLKHYHQMKVGMAGHKATKPDKSLDVVQGSMVEDLVGMLQSFKESCSNIYKHGTAQASTSEEAGTSESAGQSILDKRQAIKFRIFGEVDIHSPVKKSEPYSSSPQKKTSVLKIASLQPKKSSVTFADDDDEEDSLETFVSPTKIKQGPGRPRQKAVKLANCETQINEDDVERITASSKRKRRTAAATQRVSTKRQTKPPANRKRMAPSKQLNSDSACDENDVECDETCLSQSKNKGRHSEDDAPEASEEGKSSACNQHEQSEADEPPVKKSKAGKGSGNTGANAMSSGKASSSKSFKKCGDGVEQTISETNGLLNVSNNISKNKNRLQSSKQTGERILKSTKITKIESASESIANLSNSEKSGQPDRRRRGRPRKELDMQVDEPKSSMSGEKMRMKVENIHVEGPESNSSPESSKKRKGLPNKRTVLKYPTDQLQDGPEVSNKKEKRKGKHSARKGSDEEGKKQSSSSGPKKVMKNNNSLKASDHLLSVSPKPLDIGSGSTPLIQKAVNVAKIPLANILAGMSVGKVEDSSTAAKKPVKLIRIVAKSTAEAQEVLKSIERQKASGEKLLSNLPSSCVKAISVGNHLSPKKTVKEGDVSVQAKKIANVQSELSTTSESPSGSSARVYSRKTKKEPKVIKGDQAVQYFSM